MQEDISDIAKKLFEREKVSLQDEAERAASSAQKMMDLKKELRNFLNGVLIACIVAADLYSPGHSDSWALIGFNIRGYKVRFSFDETPCLTIKRKGTILSFSFEFNKAQKVYLYKRLRCINYGRLSEISELISIFEKETRDTETVLKERE